MTNLMLFMFFFLLSFIAMFFYTLKRQDNLYKQISDEHAQLRVLLRALESRLDSILAENGREIPVSNGETVEPEGACCDPLLHLNFEETTGRDGKDKALEINFEPPMPGKGGN